MCCEAKVWVLCPALCSKLCSGLCSGLCRGTGRSGLAAEWCEGVSPVGGSAFSWESSKGGNGADTTVVAEKEDDGNEREAGFDGKKEEGGRGVNGNDDNVEEKVGEELSMNGEWSLRSTWDCEMSLSLSLRRVSVAFALADPCP